MRLPKYIYTTREIFWAVGLAYERGDFGRSVWVCSFDKEELGRVYRDFKVWCDTRKCGRRSKK